MWLPDDVKIKDIANESRKRHLSFYLMMLDLAMTNTQCWIM